MKNIFGKIGIGFGIVSLTLSIISNHAYTIYETRDWFGYEYIEFLESKSQEHHQGIPEIQQDYFSFFRITEMNAIIWGYIISIFCSIIGLIAVFYAESEKEYTLYTANAFLSSGIGLLILNHLIGIVVVITLFLFIAYNRRKNGFDTFMQ